MISVAGYWPIKPSYLHLNCAWEYHRHGTPSSSAVSASKDSGTNLEQFAQHVRRLFGSLVWYRNCSSYCCYCCCCCLYFCKTMAYILLLSPYSYNFIKTLRLDLDEVHSNPQLYILMASVQVWMIWTILSHERMFSKTTSTEKKFVDDEYRSCFDNS